MSEVEENMEESQTETQEMDEGTGHRPRDPNGNRRDPSIVSEAGRL